MNGNWKWIIGTLVTIVICVFAINFACSQYAISRTDQLSERIQRDYVQKTEYYKDIEDIREGIKSIERYIRNGG